MAATTSNLLISSTAPTMSQTVARPIRKRRIDPESGRALEILGHAIEYLTDEFVHEGGPLAAHNSQLEAIQLLMAVNRRVYFACPEIPTFRDRCVQLLHTILHM